MIVRRAVRPQGVESCTPAADIFREGFSPPDVSIKIPSGTPAGSVSIVTLPEMGSPLAATKDVTPPVESLRSVGMISASTLLADNPIESIRDPAFLQKTITPTFFPVELSEIGDHPPFRLELAAEKEAVQPSGEVRIPEIPPSTVLL